MLRSGPGFLDISEGTQTAEIDSWNYAMRRSMQEILPGLFLGPYGAAAKSKLEELKSAGIRHLVCVRAEDEVKIVKLNFSDHFNSCVITLSESRMETLIPKIREFVKFMENWSSQSQGSVLVYCMDGMSRGPSLVIAYLMLKFGLSFKDGLRYVQQRRFCIQPSPAFELQLKEFEPICQAEMLTSQDFARAKRAHENEISDPVQTASQEFFTRVKRKEVPDRTDDVQSMEMED